MTYEVSDDPARFDLARAHRWISTESYWAEGIPLETFARSCANSLVVGAYAPDGTMAAMARVVTDRATFGWVCDVFVDAGHRGAGLGKQIMAYLRAHPDLQGFRRLHLATRDAHGLYRQFGFTDLTSVENWMEIRDPEVYRR
ncbi:MAG: GNAT family N-acetyltransferase [Phenylobacterium sp.]|jgi:GNAT superfamily N-acetyltransferase|uniref:GNAT family N-acetyltransferase n=1 Tax=unclassified Phenylobacterium TaxID=2640670 RepID=UPI0008BCA29C|nr:MULTISPECIES: GNAT family N-acetyltransferase [unclassified Phenylobacterium]MBJ7409531.1 GNAT family N-acetyltransferase [Phenylobacterium sp.]OHB26953.1 MAG: GNAT family N-acetyltransferase [Phenylobacterium sp. RIFCSPHIGHO2_01_FULL_69_31]